MMHQYFNSLPGDSSILELVKTELNSEVTDEVSVLMSFQLEDMQQNLILAIL